MLFSRIGVVFLLQTSHVVLENRQSDRCLFTYIHTHARSRPSDQSTHLLHEVSSTSLHSSHNAVKHHLRHGSNVVPPCPRPFDAFDRFVGGRQQTGDFPAAISNNAMSGGNGLFGERVKLCKRIHLGVGESQVLRVTSACVGWWGCTHGLASCQNHSKLHSTCQLW